MAQAVQSGGGTSYDDLINRAAKENGLDPALLRAVIKQESNFNPTARSSAGAQGLMQIMPLHGLSNPYDPEENVMYGAKYLANQIKAFGSVELGLAAYNAGPGNVKKYGGIPPFAETQNYVKKITADYKNGSPGGSYGVGTSWDDKDEKDSIAGSIMFGAIRFVLIAIVLIVGLLFILKAFPVTSQVVDLADPMKKVKVVKNLVKHSK